jgi:hypothetical protein
VRLHRRLSKIPPPAGLAERRAESEYRIWRCRERIRLLHELSPAIIGLARAALVAAAVVYAIVALAHGNHADLLHLTALWGGR